MPTSDLPDPIRFIRTKDYKPIKDLGRGSFGRTIVVRDEILGQDFVCKKYEPQSDLPREKFFGNFIEEIKILFLMSHRNVVRVFNYFIYPDEQTAYILMEVIDGSDIERFVEENPENINSIFEQTIAAFKYLEDKKLLHRDIRSQNILVDQDGTVKIIDFGFGRRLSEHSHATATSLVELNYWCELPKDIEDNIYDSATELYFVGKLFQLLIERLNISLFKYSFILKRMINVEREDRLEDFQQASDLLRNAPKDADIFSPQDIDTYRKFSDSLIELVSEIGQDTSTVDDTDILIQGLQSLYRSVMLEEHVTDVPALLNAFIKGKYTYFRRETFPVESLRNFLSLLQNSPSDKQQILLENIGCRIRALPKTKPKPDFDLDDEIPF